MILSRLAKVPRLARSILCGLLDQTAHVEARVGVNSSWETPLGRIEQVAWYKDNARVQGDVFVGTLSLAFDGMPADKIRPSSFANRLARPDPNAALAATFQSKDKSETLWINRPSARRENWARWRATPNVLFQLACEAPAILRYLRSGDPTIGGDLRRRLGLTPDNCGHILPDPLFDASSPPEPSLSLIHI